jgi:hypothetical protein
LLRHQPDSRQSAQQSFPQIPLILSQVIQGWAFWWVRRQECRSDYNINIFLYSTEKMCSNLIWISESPEVRGCDVFITAIIFWALRAAALDMSTLIPSEQYPERDSLCIITNRLKASYFYHVYLVETNSEVRYLLSKPSHHRLSNFRSEKLANNLPSL